MISNLSFFLQLRFALYVIWYNMNISFGLYKQPDCYNNTKFIENDWQMLSSLVYSSSTQTHISSQNGMPNLGYLEERY